jgi:drug/metabolite transporter (DMT)-like permease
MIAVIAGLTAAVAWAAAGLCASRTSRALGAWTAVAWITVFGLLGLLPLLVVAGRPGYGTSQLAWFFIAGFGSVLGLAAMYHSMESLPVGVAVGVAAGEGAIAALIGIALGASASPLVLIGTVIVSAGVASLALADERVAERTNPARPRGYGWALFASLLFGIALYATNRLATDGPLAWSVAAPRIVGPLAIAVPRLAVGAMRLTRKALPFAVAAGLTEVGGYLAVAAGSRHSLVVTDVLSSQFPVFTAVGATVFLDERLATAQRRAIVIVAVGGALVAASGA